jgi:hypothetical protein
MNDFFYGMSSVGNLFPLPRVTQLNISPYSAWHGVASAFMQTGNNMRQAIVEVANGKRQSQSSK